jgi:hypothetical protein
MRHLIILAFLFTSVIAKANHTNDTIPYWHISYGKTVIIQGNVKSKDAKIYEITLKQGPLKDLTISFVYESNQPTSSSLVVKERNEVLRTVEQDPVMGPYFVVPVRELIGTHQPNVQYMLEFYYTDDRGQKDLKLGTLLFIFK